MPLSQKTTTSTQSQSPEQLTIKTNSNPTQTSIKQSKNLPSTTGTHTQLQTQKPSKYESLKELIIDFNKTNDKLLPSYCKGLDLTCFKEPSRDRTLNEITELKKDIEKVKIQQIHLANLWKKEKISCYIKGLRDSRRMNAMNKDNISEIEKSNILYGALEELGCGYDMKIRIMNELGTNEDELIGNNKSNNFNSFLCLVCKDREPELFLEPCMHLLYCEKCYEHLYSLRSSKGLVCLICKSHIEYVRRFKKSNEK